MRTLPAIAIVIPIYTMFRELRLLDTYCTEHAQADRRPDRGDVPLVCFLQTEAPCT